MSRAVVLDAILGDSVLQSMGFTESNVRPNFDDDQRPSDEMFMHLNWGQQNIDPQIRRGPRDLTIWVHMYREWSTDYARIDDVLDRLDNLLGDIVDTAGADGESVTTIDIGDKSRDLKDGGYKTLCRSASYKVLSRKT